MKPLWVATKRRLPGSPGMVTRSSGSVCVAVGMVAMRKRLVCRVPVVMGLVWAKTDGTRKRDETAAARMMRVGRRMFRLLGERGDCKRMGVKREANSVLSPQQRRALTFDEQVDSLADNTHV